MDRIFIIVRNFYHITDTGPVTEEAPCTRFGYFTDIVKIVGKIDALNKEHLADAARNAGFDPENPEELAEFLGGLNDEFDCFQGSKADRLKDTYGYMPLDPDTHSPPK